MAGTKLVLLRTSRAERRDVTGTLRVSMPDPVTLTALRQQAKKALHDVLRCRPHRSQRHLATGDASDRHLDSAISPVRSQRASLSKPAFPLRPLRPKNSHRTAMGTPEWIAVADGELAGIQRRSTCLAGGLGNHLFVS